MDRSRGTTHPLLPPQSSAIEDGYLIDSHPSALFSTVIANGALRKPAFSQGYTSPARKRRHAAGASGCGDNIHTGAPPLTTRPTAPRHRLRPYKTGLREADGGHLHNPQSMICETEKATTLRVSGSIFLTHFVKKVQNPSHPLDSLDTCRTNN